VDKDGGRADGAGPAGDHRDQHAIKVSGRADPDGHPSSQPGYARLPPFLNLSVIRVIRVPLEA
jgi:hypothetical protein